MKTPNDFDHLQKEFSELKQKYRDQEISEQEFKTQLKSLQLKDDEGRKWTIGVQTGKWYCFEGERWIEKTPPSVQNKRAICIYCGSENDLENEVCEKCGGQIDQKNGEALCPECGSKIHPKLGYCVHCDKPDSGWKEGIDLDDEEPVQTYQVRHLYVLSFSKFFGGMGFFFGLVFGVFAGAAGYFPILVSLLPGFLQNLHGSLVGGLVFGLVAGVAGFLGFALIGMIIALLVNAVIHIFGGIEIRFGSSE